MPNAPLGLAKTLSVNPDFAFGAARIAHDFGADAHWLE
jgi:hypothetical protein